MKCNDCGNIRLFIETFEGDRTVRYDDDGNPEEILGNRMQNTGRRCAACDSEDIDEE